MLWEEKIRAAAVTIQKNHQEIQNISPRNPKKNHREIKKITEKSKNITKKSIKCQQEIQKKIAKKSSNELLEAVGEEKIGAAAVTKV